MVLGGQAVSSPGLCGPCDDLFWFAVRMFWFPGQPVGLAVYAHIPQSLPSPAGGAAMVPLKRCNRTFLHFSSPACSRPALPLSVSRGSPVPTPGGWPDHRRGGSVGWCLDRVVIGSDPRSPGPGDCRGQAAGRQARCVVGLIGWTWGHGLLGALQGPGRVSWAGPR